VVDILLQVAGQPWVQARGPQPAPAATGPGRCRQLPR